MNSGHLKPFGTVGTLINIEEFNGKYPNVKEFFDLYLAKSKTLLSRQVLVNDLHYSIWKSDEQLENDVDGLSKTSIVVDSTNDRKRIQMKFGEFLDRYQTEKLFFADSVPSILHKYITVPQPLQCDSVISTLQSTAFIMNGVNTSPLMFNEEYDSLLCLFRGNKRIVLVDTHKHPDVRQIFASKNHESYPPQINPDSVDLEQFPELANVAYHVANLTAGDCLLIPSGWVFQERCLDSTISIIYNINHNQALNVDSNEIELCSKTDAYDRTFTLDQIDWSAMEDEPQNLKQIMLNLINSKSNNFEQWQSTFSKHLSFDLNSDPETAAIFDEFYGIVDVDGNGVIAITEIEQIDGAHHHHISDVLYEMVKIVHEKQKTKPSKEKSRNEESADENNDNDDSQYEKTEF